MDLPYYMYGVKMYNGKISTSNNYKLEEVQGEIPHHFFRNLRLKKTSGDGYQIFCELKKIIVQHAIMENKIQSVLGSGVLNVAERKIMSSERSTRTNHNIRVKQH